MDNIIKSQKKTIKDEDQIKRRENITNNLSH